jgi:hypothetical protein
LNMRRSILLPTLLFLAIAPLCVNALPRPGGQEHTMDVRGYLAELGRWEAACAKLADHPQAAGELRNSLPESWRVETDGQVFVVLADWLRDDLESLEEHPKNAAAVSRRIQSRLQALRADALLLTQESSAPQPSAAREKLDAILSRREFRNAQEPAWLAQYRRRLAAWLLETVEKLFGGAHIPPRATQTVGWALAIGLPLLFLIWLIQRFLHYPFQRVVVPPKNLAPQGGWRDWTQRAAAAAARGQYRDAIRLTYWAAVYRLEESGVWQVERARTPREYLRLLPADHPQQSSLSTLTARFERIWYGGQTASADDFDFTRTRLEELGCAFPSNPATGNS